MLKPSDVMILHDTCQSKSGIEMQIHMLKACKHLENGGRVLMFNYESEMGLENTIKCLRYK